METETMDTMETKMETKMKKNRKSRFRATNTIRWINEDVKVLLDMVVDEVKENPLCFEKPTANVFYSKIIKGNIQLQKYEWSGARDKVKNLKNKYKQAIDWRKQTGQGVENGATIKETIFRMCPYFEELDILFGSRKSSNITEFDSAEANFDERLHFDNDIIEVDPGEFICPVYPQSPYENEHKLEGNELNVELDPLQLQQDEQGHHQQPSQFYETEEQQIQHQQYEEGYQEQPNQFHGTEEQEIQQPQHEREHQEQVTQFHGTDEEETQPPQHEQEHQEQLTQLHETEQQQAQQNQPEKARTLQDFKNSLLQRKRKPPKKASSALEYLNNLDKERSIYRTTKLNIEDKKLLIEKSKLNIEEKKLTIEKSKQDFEKQQFEQTMALELKKFKQKGKEIKYNKEIELSKLQNQKELYLLRMRHEMELRKLELNCSK